ncbi:sensor histidine kinase [Mongoliitalea lutea]|nr:HAMP domain-containing sensor histidine kinase [Mongoliitalea lutea]
MYLDIYNLKEVTNGYEDSTSLFIDHIGAFWGCAIFVFLVNDLFAKNYVKQSILLENAFKELDKKVETLEEVNHGKNRLLGILAHDLRGPIKSTGQILELIKKQELKPEEFREVVDGLEQQYKEIDQTLTNTLEFVLAELGSGKAQKQLRQFNPSEFTEGLIAAFSSRIQAKGILVSFEVNGLDLTLQMKLELNELEVILRNLLDNAIKYSPMSSRLTVRLMKTGEMLRWEIQDEGPGMDENKASQLFKFKVQSTVGTSNEKGVGLGMYLCKSLAEKIGAELSFTSQLNKGTTFILEKSLIQQEVVEKGTF